MPKPGEIVEAAADLLRRRKNLHVDVKAVHVDLPKGPHADVRIPHNDGIAHADTPGGAHADVPGFHTDFKVGPFAHIDSTVPHADIQVPPHIDLKRHFDVREGPHADAVIWPHQDAGNLHVDTPHIDIPAGPHTDTRMPPHGDTKIHIDTPKGPHIDAGGHHADWKLTKKGPHVDQTTPHGDYVVPPHGDTSPHIDTPAGPHIDSKVPPHVDIN